MPLTALLRAYRVRHARFIDWVLNELAQQTNDAERANPDIDACTPRLDVI